MPRRRPRIKPPLLPRAESRLHTAPEAQPSTWYAIAADAHVLDLIRVDNRATSFLLAEGAPSKRFLSLAAPNSTQEANVHPMCASSRARGQRPMLKWSEPANHFGDLLPAHGPALADGH
jgi:hypothetical protein